MTAAGSPGTDGRHTQPQPHPWTPSPPEPGLRTVCKHCPQPRHQHEKETRTR